MSAAACVLLVEDNPDNRYLATVLLEAEGYAVRAAANGLEATDLSRHETYVCALVDIQLPDIDGFEVARRLRERVPGLPVIVVSAFPEAVERRRAQRAGCCGYIEKPIDADRFVATVRRMAGMTAA